MLGDRYHVLNFGVSGASASQGCASSYKDLEQFDMVLKFVPDYIVLMLGTNDCQPHIEELDTFQESFEAILEGFCEERSTMPVVFVCHPVPLFLSGFEDSFALMMNKINQTLSSYSRQSSAGNGVDECICSATKRAIIETIDVYSACNDQSLFPDDVHPDEEGCKVIATTVYKSLTTWIQTNVES